MKDNFDGCGIIVSVSIKTVQNKLFIEVEVLDLSIYIKHVLLIYINSNMTLY